MGVYAQLLAQKKTFGSQSSLATWIASQQTKGIDPPVPAAAAAINAVGSLADSTMTAGNMTLTIGVRQADGTIESATTGNILFSATAATVETAIDTALTGIVTGWTNGDISVSGTAVNSGPLTFTFDGSSVAGKQAPLIVLTDVDGTGGAWGVPSVTTDGQTERAALSVLLALNVISGTVPLQDAVTSITSFTDSENRNHNIPANIVKALMREAAFEDANNATYHSIDAAIFGAGEDRSPLVEERVTGDNTR
jgi:hypothetical protein